MAREELKAMEKAKVDTQRFIEKNPVLLGMAIIAAGLLTITTPGKQRSEVPGLGGRRNSAWRGKGSFGSAPFGSQVGHRR